MQKRTPKPKLVVIGAGVSTEFGVPLADNLLDEVVRWYLTTNNSTEVAPIVEFIDEFYHDSFQRSGKLPAAEDVLTFLDAAGDYSNIRSPGVGYKWRSERVRQIKARFLRLLGEYLWSFQNRLTEERLGSLRTLVRRIGIGHVYATFNYDLLLETCLSVEGLPYHYMGPPKRDSVLILKPHGSINWYHKDDLANIRELNDFVRLGDSLYAYRGLDVFSIPFRRMKSPVLIAPTINKQFSTFEQRKTWTTFSSVIQRTRRAFIVGYSLPLADFTSRIVLNRLGAHQSDAKQVTVVNPDRAISNHMSDLVSTYHFFIRSKFGEWLRTDPFFSAPEDPPRQRLEI